MTQLERRLYLIFPKVSPTAPPHEQLTYYRQVRGFSKEELGALIGVPMGEIVNYEKRSQEIYYEQAEKLAEALNIDVELLLDDHTRFVSPGFGQRIKEIRASLGFTQQKYAELLGVGRCLISIWEIELYRPSRKNYLKILESKAGSERSVQQ